MAISQGFQIPFAEQIRAKAGIATMGVGLPWDAEVGDDEGHALWPPESGWWLNRRDRLVEKLGLRG